MYARRQVWPKRILFVRACSSSFFRPLNLSYQKSNKLRACLLKKIRPSNVECGGKTRFLEPVILSYEKKSDHRTSKVACGEITRSMLFCLFSVHDTNSKQHKGQQKQQTRFDRRFKILRGPAVGRVFPLASFMKYCTFAIFWGLSEASQNVASAGSFVAIRKSVS